MKHQKKTGRKLLTLFVALTMIFSMFGGVSLTENAFAASNVLYGGETITEGGAYQLAEETTEGSVITIATTEEVTIIGNGADFDEDGMMIDSPQVNLVFDASGAPGAHLTLENVYLSNGFWDDNEETSANLINFAGTGNVLTISGTCVLDHDVNALIYSSIHVGLGTDLTIEGDGTLYFYKRSQGAGIGGDTEEMNGDITFDMDGGSAFIKGTKQGAVIGAGANASSSDEEPGTVTFLSGTYNLIGNARGAVIGGSAGSGGGSTGTTVYIEGGLININTDYSGASVGGGGYAEGNDSSGGTMYVNGGSLRVYIDTNAANNVTTGWQGRSFTVGINDASITAQRLNDDGEEVHWLWFNTKEISPDENGEYTVYIDDSETPFYEGGRYGYYFIQEALDKELEEQYTITSTPSNWIEMSGEKQDYNLYLWLSTGMETQDDGTRTGTPAQHTVTVNGESFIYQWNDDDYAFELVTEDDEEELQIITQPEDYTGSVGSTAVFGVEATGTGLSYQWQYLNAGASTWRNSGLSGADTASLSVSVTEARNGQQYRCVVTDGDGNTVTSDAAILTVSDEAGLSITQQPADYTGAAGSTAVFEVEATGSGLTYQWQYLNAGASNWKDSGLSGATTATLAVSVTEARGGQQYRCVVTDSDGNTVTSDAATLTVSDEAGLSITQQPIDYSGTVGSTATFSVEATGTGLSYQWQYLNAGGVTWRDSGLSGATTATLSVSVTKARDGQQYRCVVTDSDGNTVTSDAATLTVADEAGLSITQQPTDYTGTAGSTATFSVEATGTGLSYQWQYMNAGGLTWRDSGMTGATTATLSVSVTEARDGQQYRCIVTDENGDSVISEAATLSVG